MNLSKPQRLILYSLGEFYSAINQPLIEKPVKLRTSKIAFIELLMQSKILSKQERALYKNLESLQDMKLIDYENRMIRFTERGLEHLQIVSKDITPFVKVTKHFGSIQKPRRKMQTVIQD